MTQLPYLTFRQTVPNVQGIKNPVLYTRIGSITQVDNSEINVILHIQVCCVQPKRYRHEKSNYFWSNYSSCWTDFV